MTNKEMIRLRARIAELMEFLGYETFDKWDDPALFFGTSSDIAIKLRKGLDSSDCDIAAGFYAPELHTVCINVKHEFQYATMAHELVHSLQNKPAMQATYGFIGPRKEGEEVDFARLDTSFEEEAYVVMALLVGCKQDFALVRQNLLNTADKRNITIPEAAKAIWEEVVKPALILEMAA